MYRHQYGGGWYGVVQMYVVSPEPITQETLEQFVSFIEDHREELEEKGFKFDEYEYMEEEAYEDLRNGLQFKVVDPSEYPRQFPNQIEELGTPYLIEIEYKGPSREYAEFFFEAAKKFFADAPFLSTSLALQSEDYVGEAGFLGMDKIPDDAYYEASLEARNAAGREEFEEWKDQMVHFPGKRKAKKNKTQKEKMVNKQQTASSSSLSSSPSSSPSSSSSSSYAVLRPNQNAMSAGGQCRCKTQKGTRCSRNSKPGTQFCFQHMSCANTI
jgi:hypothetical protein